MEILSVVTGYTSIYSIFKFNGRYMLGKYGDKCAPLKVGSSSLMLSHVYGHRYTRYHSRMEHDTLMKEMTATSHTRAKPFICIGCNTLEYNAGTPPCLHPMCSECVSEFEYRSKSCLVCGDRINSKWSRKTLFGIPMPHLFRLLCQVDEPIATVGQYHA